MLFSQNLEQPALSREKLISLLRELYQTTIEWADIPDFIPDQALERESFCLLRDRARRWLEFQRVPTKIQSELQDKLSENVTIDCFPECVRMVLLLKNEQSCLFLPVRVDDIMASELASILTEIRQSNTLEKALAAKITQVAEQLFATILSRQPRPAQTWYRWVLAVYGLLEFSRSTPFRRRDLKPSTKQKLIRRLREALFAGERLVH